MNMKSFNNLIENTSLKGKVGNSCCHSLIDRFVPAAYAILGTANKLIIKS
jgi:hypothetical protein